MGCCPTRLPKFAALPILKEQEMRWVVVALVQIILDTALLGTCMAYGYPFHRLIPLFSKKD